MTRYASEIVKDMIKELQDLSFLLTDREDDIIDHKALGMNGRNLSQELGLALGTVSTILDFIDEAKG